MIYLDRYLGRLVGIEGKKKRKEREKTNSRDLLPRNLLFELEKNRLRNPRGGRALGEEKKVHDTNARYQRNAEEDRCRGGDAGFIPPEHGDDALHFTH